MKTIKALIICGYGVNCEKEVAVGCQLAGAKPHIIHAHHLLKNEIKLEDYHLIVFPGGFSFGDDLGAGKAFANRLSYSRSPEYKNPKDQLQLFVDRGGCILGICNGFQLLAKLNLLPGFERELGKQKVSLVFNDCNHFQDYWVYHRALKSKCIFTKDLDTIYLPVRHGEGKFIVSDHNVLKQLENQSQIVFKYAKEDGSVANEYPHNPNGSIQSIAGICDNTGRILGMMAHPEGFLFFPNHPNWLRIKDANRRKNLECELYGDGLKLFVNAVNYLKGNL